MALDNVNVREAGPHERVHCEFAADSVQGRERDPHRPVGVPHMRRTVDVALNEIDTGGLDSLPTPDFATSPT